jgi:arylsulfatase A-like enzyme
VGLLVVAILLVVLGSCSGRRDTEPFNIVLISLDTLRADHVGAYGYQRDTSPNMDQLARNGVLFADTIAPAPQTLASHASLFTSLIPSHHGALANFKFKLSEDAVTMAEILAEQGYATVSFNDGGLLDPEFGCDQGFDVYDSTMRKSRFASRVEPAAQWLSDRLVEPFFLFLHTYEVHLPLVPEPEYLALFESDYEGPLPGHFGGKVLKEFRGGKYGEDPADIEHIVAIYDACIRSMDSSLGDLIGALKDNRLYDRSLIIVTSDHGEEYGERGRIAVHGPTLYDEVIRVPLIIKFPHDRFGGTVVDRQVRLIDILPTTLEVIGVEPLPHFEGSSLIGLVRGDEDRDLPAVSETKRGSVSSLRDSSWKLIRGNRRRQLFDLTSDPGESQDLIEQRAVHADSLEESLDEIRASRPSLRTDYDPSAESVERLRALGYVE